MAGFFDDVGKFFGGLFSGNKADQQEQQRRSNAATFKAVNAGNNSRTGLNTSSQFQFGSIGGNNQDSLAEEMERKRKEEEERKKREEEQRKAEEARKAREAVEQAQRQAVQQTQAQQAKKVNIAQALKSGGLSMAQPSKPRVQQQAQVGWAKPTLGQEIQQKTQNQTQFSRPTLGQEINNRTPEQKATLEAQNRTRQADTERLRQQQRATSDAFGNWYDKVDGPAKMALQVLGADTIDMLMSSGGVAKDDEQFRRRQLARNGISQDQYNQMSQEQRDQIDATDAATGVLDALGWLPLLGGVAKGVSAGARIAPRIGGAISNSGVVNGIGQLVNQFGREGAKRLVQNEIKRVTAGATIGTGLQAGGTALMGGEITLEGLGHGALMGIMGAHVPDVNSGAVRGTVNNVRRGANEAYNTVQQADTPVQGVRDVARDVISRDGPMGREYTQFRGGDRSGEAIDYIDRRGQGMAREAVRSSDNIDYDLPYGRVNAPGQKGYGLSHMRDDHPGGMDNVRSSVDAIENGKRNPGDEWRTRAAYDLNNQRAVTADNFNNSTEYKPILTGYKETDLPAGTNPIDSAPRSVNDSSVANNTTDVNSKIEIEAEAPNGAQVVRETTPSGAQREYVVNTGVDEAAQMQAQRQAVKRADDAPTIDEAINEPRSGVNQSNGVVLGVRASAPSQRSGIIQGVKSYVDNQVKNQQQSTKLPLKQKLNNTYDNLKHFLVDDAVAYERYIKGEGERLVLREGVDRVRNSDMIARQWAEDHGIRELGRMSPDEMNEFSQYLIAKRSQELKRQKGADFATGRNEAMDQALIDSVGNKYAREEQIVRDYNRDMLNYSVDNDLISPELRDRLLADNTDYVPMNRVMDDVDEAGVQISKQLGNLSKQNVVKKIKGSEREVENPIESMILNTQRMVNEAERNQVAMRLADSSELAERVLKEGEKARPGYDTLNYLADGQKYTIEVPALVAKEMKNLNSVLPDYAQNILRVVGAPTRILRTGATSANPIFALSNVLRDQIQTLFTGNIRTTLNPRANIQAMQAAFNPASAQGKALRAELARNGIVGNEYRQTYGYKSGQLIKELQQQSSLPKQALERLRRPIDSLADLIGRTEYYTRAQQFYGTLNRGGTVEQAAQAARNNTLNFSRGGSITRVLNKVIPFLNAGVQGGRTLTRQFVERPARTATMLGATTGVAIAVMANNQAQNPELWERVGDEEKKNNLVLFTPDAHYNPDTNRVEGVVKIPMPQMLYPVLDAVNNFKGVSPESMMNIAANIFTAFSGIDATNPFNQLTPTAAKPLLENAINRDLYTGNDVVSEYEGNMAPQDKGTKYSTGLARGLAGLIGVDAPQIDNFIQDWGGGLFKDLTKTMTDNPDNVKDGGGIGGVFGESFTRRFMSGAVTSQYEIQENLAKGYKNDVRGNEAFQQLSNEEQKKVLDAIDSDTKAIAGIAAKTEQNKSDEIKRDLSERQRDLTENGFDASRYINSIKNGDGSVINESREWYGVTNDGKIKRYDGATASYGGDISGLTRDQQNLLSMTQSELERDAENNKWDTQALWYEAEAAALQRQLEAVQQGYNNGQNSKQDIATIEGQIAKANESKTVSSVNQRFQNDAGVSQALAEMGASTYDIAKLYGETSLTEWRNMENGSLKELLAIYDSERTADKVSGKSGDKASNKYYAGKGSGSGGSKKKANLGPDIITPTLKTPTISAPTFDSNTKKGKGIVKGLTTRKLNTEAKVTALPRVAIR